MNSVANFERIVKLLQEAEARVVVIGGLALILHGGDHVTKDVDFAYLRSRENAKRIAEALRPYHPRPIGFPEDLPYVWDDQTLFSTTVVTLQTDLGPIDLLGAPDGAPVFEELWTLAERADLNGTEVRFASLDHLKAMKRAANRPQDLRHLAEIEALIQESEGV